MGSKFFFFRVDPFSEGRQTIVTEFLLLLKCVSVLHKVKKWKKKKKNKKKKNKKKKQTLLNNISSEVTEATRIELDHNDPWLSLYVRATEVRLYITSTCILTHCMLNRIFHTIYWKSPFSILGTSGYEI